MQNPAAMPLLLVGLEEYLDASPEADIAGVAAEARPDLAADNPVTVRVRIAEGQKPTTGEVVRGVLAVHIKEGWHIYANPTGAVDLKPTILVLDPGQAATDLSVDYPAGQTKVLGSLGTEKVALYEGKIDIPFRVSLPREIRAGKTTVRLRLNYQACNDRVCLAPASLAIPLEVSVGLPAGPVESKP